MAWSILANPSPAGTGSACQGFAAAKTRTRLHWPGSEQQHFVSCSWTAGSVCISSAGGPGPARVQDCRQQQRKCRWRVQAFDVHEALSAEAARQQRNIPCNMCSGRGWLLCDFCEGKKTEVPAKTGRIYRRCPSCKAVGVLMCSECRVYKCMTFPDSKDGGFEME